MIDVIKCITVLVLFIYELKQHTVLSQQYGGCDIKPGYRAAPIATCNRKGITSIPQDFPPDIDYLDISFNNITTLDENALKNYPSLLSIGMVDLPITSFPHNFFKYSKMLVTLNISKTQISNLNVIPRSIETLNFTYCQFEYVNLSHLNNLVQLFMRHSHALKIVPILDKFTDIHVIDLKYCSLTEANYSQIAPFCHLRYFGLNSTQLRTEEHLYRCCSLKRWCKTTRIPSGYKLQGCNDTQSNHSSCKSMAILFDEHSKNEFSACYKRTGIKIFVLIFLGLFLCVLSVALAIVAVHHLYDVGSLDKILKRNPGNKEPTSSGLSSVEMNSETYEGSENS